MTSIKYEKGYKLNSIRDVNRKMQQVHFLLNAWGETQKSHKHINTNWIYLYNKNSQLHVCIF